jgi:hypothetical protein
MAQSLNRSHFAEFAEAIGVTTDCVLGTVDLGGDWGVLYTRSPNPHPEEWVWYAHIKPDGQRILRVTARRQAQKISEFNDDVAELMKRQTG